jgi:hypothetical protein
MTETSCTLDEVLSKLMINLDFLRKLNESLILGAKLAESGFTPTPDVSISCDGKTEESAACNVVYRLAIERFYVLWNTCDLSTFANTKLSLEASSPCINISLIGKN